MNNKFLTIILIICTVFGIAIGLLVPVCGENQNNYSLEELETMIDNCQKIKTSAHNLASEARILGWEEKSETIQKAKICWNDANEKEKIYKIYYEDKLAEQNKYNITYYPFETTNLNVEQFNIILENTGLAGNGQAYFDLEKNYGVNGIFAIAVAFHESGYGKYKANTNNFYGMKGNNGWMAFNTSYDNIQYFGKLMNKNLYYGKNIEDIGNIYCPPVNANNRSWPSAVKNIMNICYNKII